MFNSNSYNPDVLTCLANLSSDEVFTPPQLANRFLIYSPPTSGRTRTPVFSIRPASPACFCGRLPNASIRGWKDKSPTAKSG